MKPITFATVCSGIGAPEEAWTPLGWRALWASEIEAAPAAILAHRHPSAMNLGDMTRLPQYVRDGWIPAPDVLCGGTPCQAYSLAGLRQGLNDPRGQLTLKFVELANEIDAKRDAGDECIVVWENVPGVLSDSTNAFGCFLAGLAGEDVPLVAPRGKWPNAGLVVGPQRAIAWRIVDAQYFGVAQRRRRVLVVASARNGFDPGAVLLEFDGLRRDSAPRREAREETAAGTLRSSDGGCDVDHARAGHILTCVSNAEGSTGLPFLTCSNIAKTVNNQTPLLAFSSKDYGDDCTVDLSPTLRAGGHSGSHANAGGQLAVCVTGTITHALKAEGADASEDGTGRGNPIVPVLRTVRDVAGTITSNYGKQIDSSDTNLGPNVVLQQLQHRWRVRRLTPRECERLQSFPSILESVIVEVCLDPQNNCVHVALQCRKSRVDAWPVGDLKSMPYASAAAPISSTPPADPVPLAALRARTDSGGEAPVIRYRGKSISSANAAAGSSPYRPPTPAADFVARLVRLAQCLAPEAPHGKAASHRSIKLSIAAGSGDSSAPKSGSASAASANAAIPAAQQGKFTMSDLGRATPTCDSTIATSLCSALAAISSFIPDEILPASFYLQIEVETPYTLVPYRGRMMADGPRYKALGNSMCVYKMRWLGRRIASALTNSSINHNIGL